MDQLFLQIIMFGSLAVFVYVFSRALPRIKAGEHEEEPRSIRNILSSLPIHKFDEALASFTEKNLRRTRVLILKFDNTVMGFLHKLRTRSGQDNARQRELFNKENEPASFVSKPEEPEDHNHTTLA